MAALLVFESMYGSTAAIAEAVAAGLADLRIPVTVCEVGVAGIPTYSTRPSLLVVGEETLLLFEHRLVRLSPLAQAIFEAADCASEDALAAALERRFGAPADGDALEATRAAVADLEELGVVTREP